ncbi:MAG: NAD(P)-binding protein, partial [Blastochloris sp.]|nr:NAD(P)-binding protein [Blastochloris sp.]
MTESLTPATHPKIAILGAGITGLSAAWFLQKLGHQPVLFESASRPGGVIHTGQEQGFVFEHGPNSLLLKGSALAELLQDLDLESQIIEANPAANLRFIVRAGKIQALPLSPLDALTNPFLSFPAKLRLLLEPFQPKSSLPDEPLSSSSAVARPSNLSTSSSTPLSPVFTLAPRKPSPPATPSPSSGTSNNNTAPCSKASSAAPKLPAPKSGDASSPSPTASKPSPTPWPCAARTASASTPPFKASNKKTP